MSFQVTGRVIKQWCGQAAYDRGEAYYRDGKVSMSEEAPNGTSFNAVVKGSSSYQVSIDIDQDGDVGAACTCPAYLSYDHYCKHIAAVLLHVQDLQGSDRAVGISYKSLLQPEGEFLQREAPSSGRSLGVSAGDAPLLNGMLALFTVQPSRPSRSLPRFESRVELEAEWICTPVAYGYRKYVFGIEMKVGPKRPYIVQRIKEFLESIDRRRSYVFSRHFTYEPAAHSFPPAHDAVIRQLIEIVRNDKLYQETSGYASGYGSRGIGRDRMLLVPPYAWEGLQAALLEAPSVRLEYDGRVAEGLQYTDEPLPLRFTFREARTEGYELAAEGLDRLTVMESYGIVMSYGKLHRLGEESCRRLAELKRMLEVSRKPHVRIPPEQMEPFLEKAVPGLMELGDVHIAQSVSNRIVRTPLKAKLYLDRVKDRLLAGLEFQYGDMVFNPLEREGRRENPNRFLLRDGASEQRILEWMEIGGFTRTDAGYFMEDEEAEYEFLKEIVPQLEKLADIYASAAVKARIHPGPIAPKLVVNVDERTDWLEFKFDIEGIPESDIREVLQSVTEKRKYHRLPNGALLPLEGEALKEIIRIINETGFTKKELTGDGTIRLPIARGLHVMELQEQGRSVRLGKSLRQLLDHMRNPDTLDFPVPARLAPVLRDYQTYGFQWMKTLAHYRFGGILADDMGLGKTLQSIAFLVSVLSEIRSLGRPALIVAPASLIYNWRNELKKFAPELRSAIVDGSKAERSGTLKDAASADVMITSYPLLRRDVDTYARHSFHTLILDEAQTFKNHATQTAQAVKKIQARHRFALTGTPVENRLEELWSIFDAVFPELFPGLRAFTDLSRETVARRIRPFLLRRVKSDVLKELPEKIEMVQPSELLPAQKKLYAAYLAKLQQDTLKHLSEDGFQKHRIKILSGLTRLRQLCCHPALFVQDYAGSSAKFEQLLELVEECRSAGRRILVFSQFTEMLGLIGRAFGERGVPFFYLDGATAASERVELCSRFNEGEQDVFLISLKAGGTGLNLTGADTVILYDLWWNPAVEQQAADRAHRMGQKNIVQVIRLVAQGTVEDKMYELQQRKKNLIDEVIQPGQEALSALTERDLREILMI
jgi:hypothetical protein